MNNMEVWDKVKQPPASALKQIQAGRLKGKSDINPQWRYQVMTEQFGMAGIGWGYEIKRLWNETASDGQVFAFAEIELWAGDMVHPIPGIGGSMLITKEQSGLHSSDEGYKMAITDALSVAMKMLGVAADVYGGLWDGSKYQNAPKAGKVVMDGVSVKLGDGVKKDDSEKQTIVKPDDPATEPQLKAMFAIQRDMGITDDLDRHEHVSRILGLEETITSFKILTKGQASIIIDAMQKEKDI